VCWTTVAALIWPQKRRGIAAAGAGLGVGLLGVAAWYDQYTTVWERVRNPAGGNWVEVTHLILMADPLWDTERVTYRDTYTRWRKRLVYRRVSFHAPKGSTLDDSAEGPLAGSGKQHGEWNFVYWHPFRAERRWYWYGDEITEGEWHLRDK